MVLAEFSPWSGRAGTEAVGSSPSLARVGLVSWRDVMRKKLRRAARRACRTRTRSRMKRWMALAMLACAAAAAQDGDPLKSPACGDAIAALDAARSAKAAPAQVEVLRARAAQTCLGTADPPRRPARVLQPPVAIPPPPLAPPGVAAPQLLVTPPPPPVTITRPPQVTQCDPAGCWVDDGGNRLRHLPPHQVSPRGPCTIVGALVYCP
jgi:hypothetical protein